MWKRSIWLGALAGLVMTSLAEAQSAPPVAPAAEGPAASPPEAAPPEAAPPETAPPEAAPSRPPAGRPLPAEADDAPMPHGGRARSSEEAPEPPDRSGATFEMSAGFGLTHVALDSGPSDDFGGISGLNLGLGGWVSSRTALTLRIASTSFFEQVGSTEVQFIAGMIGLSLQHMVTDQVWVGGGVGVGVLTTDQDNIESETGLSLDLRAGVNLYQSRRNAFHLAVEVTPGFFDGLNVTGFGFQLGWQAL